MVSKEEYILTELETQTDLLSKILEKLIEISAAVRFK
jgi:hypothetical protein